MRMNRPIPEDMNDIIMAEQRAKIKELEKENKDIQEHLRYYKTKSEFLNKVIVKYQEENKELRQEIGKLKLDNEIQKNHRFFGIHS
jgi:peptidoglycan hydrolase CwlO-like protein